MVGKSDKKINAQWILPNRLTKTIGSTQIIIIKDNIDSIIRVRNYNLDHRKLCVGNGTGSIWRDKYGFIRDTDEHEQKL